MKKTLLSIIFILSVAMLYGQDNYMSLSFGGAIPIGDFGKSENILNDGFAETGFAGDYSAAWYLSQNFGIAGNVLFVTSPINQSKAREGLESLVPEDFPTDSIRSLELEGWNVINLFVGPQITIPVSNFNFDFYALGGMSIVIPPKMRIQANYQGQSFETVLSAQNVRLGAELGTAIRYNLNENYGFRLFASSLFTSTTGDLEQKISGGSNLKSDYKSPIQTFNVGFGLVYRL